MLKLMTPGKLSILFLFFIFPLLVPGQEGEKAFASMKEADASIEAENYAQALKKYEVALPYFLEKKDWFRVAYLYLWMGEAAYGEGNYNKALEFTQKSQSVAEANLRVDTLSYYSLIHQNLGVFYSALGDFEHQLKHYELAFQQALQFHGRESPQAADAYFSIGVAYGRRGDWNRCISYTDTSLQISQVIDYQGGIASAYINLAHAFAVKEDYAKAIEYQTQALNLSSSKAETARGYNNLGMYYNDLGELQPALNNLKKALRIRREIYPQYHDNVLSTLLNFARVYYDAGQHDQSNAYIDQVINHALRAAEENQAYLKIAYNYKAISLLNQDQLNRAEAYFLKAREVDGRQLKVDANVALVGANIYLKMKEFDQALEEIQAALASRMVGFEPKHYYENPALNQIEDISMALDLLEMKAEILFEKANARNSTKDLEVALVVYQLLDALVIKSRSTYLNSKSKELMSANAHTLYAGAIAVLHQLYEQTLDPAYFDMALGFSEKNKSLSLTEKLNDLYARSFANIPGNIVKKERQLLQEIEFYNNQLLRYKESAETEIVNDWQKILFEKGQRRASLLKEIQTEYPQYYDLRYNFEMPSSTDIVQKLLDEEEMLLEYFLSKDYLFIFLVGKKERAFLNIPVRNGLKDEVELFRESLLQQEDSFYDRSHQLFQTLLAPVWEKVQNRPLLIITDGLLGYLPFEALLSKSVYSTDFDDHRKLPYLLRSNLIRYYFSAHSAILQSKHSRQSPSGQILALAPVFSQASTLASAEDLNPDRKGLIENLSPLEGSLEEVDRLRSHFEGAFIKGADASEFVFKNRAGQYKMLHIATHTLIDDRFPGLSKLVFSTESSTGGEDGLLHAYELYNMQLNAELVTLSSCNTGYGRLKKGEGIASMASAFAYAGCPNMVMSLWQVKDQTTPEIMDRFYSNLAKGMIKNQALQEAKIDFLDNYKRLYGHPYFWASFIYMGDQQALEAENRKSNRTIWVGLAILLCLLVIYGMRKIR